MLDLTPYQGKLDLAIKAAKEQGVIHMLCLCDLQHLPTLIEIAEKYKEVSTTVEFIPRKSWQKPEPDDYINRASIHP
jgi:Tat protein secretion system quality control protein TatD with DNase activity